MERDHWGDYSPWGKIQSSKQLAEGILSVSTAGHGGIKLDRKRNNKVPAYMRRKGGWYEEDCEWSIPAVCFSEAFPDLKEEAWKTFKNHYPDEYERMTGNALQEGESYKRDQEIFYAKHKESWLVISAFGSWHPKVPQGFAGVCATVGGIRGKAEQWFLVPSEEYKNYSFSFVIDTTRHKAIDPLVWETR